MEGGPNSSHGQGGAFFISLIIVLLAGCSTRYTPAPFNAAEHLPTVPYEDTPEHLFEDAVRARESGDSIGAIQRFSSLVASNHGTLETTYQLGIALEEGQHYAQAAGVYHQLKSEASGPMRQDAAFRLALCLWEIGEDRAAARAIRSISSQNAYQLSDRYTYDLAVGVAWTRVGKKRRGEQKILETLVAADGSNKAHWMRSLALHALLENTLSYAEEQDLTVRPKRQFKQLTARVTLLREAEDYLRRIMLLGEPHWMLAGWLDLGDAYTSFASDMREAPVPKSLTPPQQEHYRAQLNNQAAPLQNKAILAYDRGLEVAIRSGRMDLQRATLLQERIKKHAP